MLSTIVSQLVGDNRLPYLVVLFSLKTSLPVDDAVSGVTGDEDGDACSPAVCSKAAFLRLLPRLERRRSLIADFTAVKAFCEGNKTKE